MGDEREYRRRRVAPRTNVEIQETAYPANPDHDDDAAGLSTDYPSGFRLSEFS